VECDVSSNPKQLLGAIFIPSHEGTFQSNPTFSTSALLIGEGRETVLGPATAASMPQFLKGSVQLWKIIWMDLGPHLSEGLWLPFLPMPVNVPITHVILEPARF